MTEYRDGDIYFWTFKVVDRPGQYGSYHCKSQIAIAKDGRLLDTFWGHTGEAYIVDPEITDLVYQGNENEMRKISTSDAQFYKYDDVCSMAHSNNSGAPVYAKHMTAKDADVMRERLAYLADRARYAISSAERALAEIETDLVKIADGRLDEVYAR